MKFLSKNLDEKLKSHKRKFMEVKFIKEVW